MDDRSNNNEDCREILNVVVNRIAVALDTCDITYIESKGRKAYIHVVNAWDPVITYEKLSDLLKRLPLSTIRCHGSFLVNLSHVHEVAKTECRLSDGTSVPVSRSCRQDVVHAFRMYQHEA